MGWIDKPTSIDLWPTDPNVEVAIFVDESGRSDLKHINKCLLNGCPISTGNLFFTMAACCIRKNNLLQVKQALMQLKYTYWGNGLYQHTDGTTKRVLLHSYDIGKPNPPFISSLIDRSAFEKSLLTTVQDLPFQALGICIHKVEHVKQYPKTAFYPYDLCCHVLLERICMNIMNNLPRGKKCIIIFERRGNNEDLALHKSIIGLLSDGTEYAHQKEFDCISGVYFNDKWVKSDCRQSYYCLELADIIAYPIHQFLSVDYSSDLFEAIKPKIFGVNEGKPNYGLIKLPKKRRP